MKNIRRRSETRSKMSSGTSERTGSMASDGMDSVINVRNMIRFLGITIALMLITLGIWTGGYQDILNKATHICLECIGIG